MFKGPMATTAFVQSRGSNESSKEWIGPIKLDSMPNVESKPSKSRLEFGSRGHRNTIAVGDVDGRAFDILLRYLYNERIQLQSVMTALTTLYAAHKYMCPGLAKQVVAYLKENLSETNVLLVLQHICLYCSGSAENNYHNTTIEETGGDTYWNIPVTEPPRRSSEILSEKESLAPSAPPDHEEDQLLLASDDDLHNFVSGMSVTATNGNRRVKVNCCNALLKQCLEFIDVKASAVLGSEDIEDLDISAVKMIVCRDTLSVEKEAEVFAALLRWSTRECKRQRMELTAENRRNVLEGSQYLVRYLVMSQDEFTKGPYRSGILTKEEEESILSNINGANAVYGGCSLPDHLTGCESLMRTRRRGQNPPHGINIPRSSKSGKRHSKKNQRGTKWKKDSGRGCVANDGMIASRVMQNGVVLNNATAANNQKDKFNIIEEFFVCLACIFD